MVMNKHPDRKFGGKKYEFCSRRRKKREAKTAAENYKKSGVIKSYRIFKSGPWWYIYGSGVRFTSPYGRRK